MKLNGKWGVIDKIANEILDFKYDEIILLNNMNYEVRMDKKWGILSPHGKVLTKVEYDYFLPIKKNEALGLKGMNFEIIYNSAFRIQQHSAIVKKITNAGITLEVPLKSGKIMGLTYKISGLLHIDEVNRAKVSFKDFREDDIISVYIISADEEKQILSFSIINPK